MKILESLIHLNLLQNLELVTQKAVGIAALF